MMPIGSGTGEHFTDVLEWQAFFQNPGFPLAGKKRFSDEGGPVLPPPDNGDMDMWNTDQRPPAFMKVDMKLWEAEDWNNTWLQAHPYGHPREKTKEDAIKSVPEGHEWIDMPSKELDPSSEFPGGILFSRPKKQAPLTS